MINLLECKYIASFYWEADKGEIYIQEEVKMACFIAPAAEAVVTVVASKVVEKKEVSVDHVKVPFSKKLKWLTNMLTGGSVLLAFEHLWHGEITPWAPFLTAAATAEDTAEMLQEIATTGVGMAALITCVWGGMLVVSRMLEKKSETEASVEN